MSETKNYLSLSIKLILFLSIINSINNQLWHIMSTNIFLLFLMFLPDITKKYKVKIPRSFEWALLVFIIFTLFLGKIRSFIAPITFGIAVGFIGLMILAILYSSNQIKKNYFLIVLFSFNFALAFGTILELLKYFIKKSLGHELTLGTYQYSMQNLTFVLIGALISVSMGFAYMKGYSKVIRNFIDKIINSNPKIFKKENIEEELLETISKGESEKLEFKETLRYNLYTNENDRRVEHSVLKTICAFLNSKGGTLVLGVNDKGEISGIEKDKFGNEDKFLLHLTNIIKQQIGKKFMGLIEMEIKKINNKKIALINCSKSKKEVFLKPNPKEEEFYIRAGPSSTQIHGSELIEYIERKFRIKN